METCTVIMLIWFYSFRYRQNTMCGFGVYITTGGKHGVEKGLCQKNP